MKLLITTSITILLQLSIMAQTKTALVKGNNEFAFDIYQMVNDENKNVFLSPFSISTALGMVYSGARNATAKEMAQVLHFDEDISQSNSDFKNLIDFLNKKNNQDIKINVANRLFADLAFEFNPTYLANCEENFHAPLEKLNFKNDDEGNRKKINTWVEDKTNNKIKELLKKGVISNKTKLVLVNAIYFYGDWMSQFDSLKTKKKDFFTDETNSINHDFMYQQHGYEYMEDKSFQAIRVPYKGNQFYLEIYLPNKKDGLADFEKEFTVENYNSWETKFNYNTVKLTIPKFKLTCDFSLSEILKKMGMAAAFSNEADFLNMTTTAEDALKIDAVIHKAFIDVSEKGTEAAAATAITMVRTTSTSFEPIREIKVFNADHPFIFVIKERMGGSILFMGKMVNPK